MDVFNQKNVRQMLFFGALIVVAGIVFMSVGGKSSLEQIDSTVVGDVEIDKVQKATLSFRNYAYVLEPSTFRAGVPVELTVDMNTVYGCMRDVRIPTFGVAKLVSQGDNVIRFTPDKVGTFDIACSMNMGRGTFSVTA